jgi:hypothetical protein
MTDWLAELVSSPVKEYLQFEAALSLLPGLPPGDVANLLTQRARTLELQLVQRRAVMAETAGGGLPRLFVLEDEYQACLLEAELHYVRRLIDDIETGALEGIETWRGFHEPGDRPDKGDEQR